jgi:hypothetical protein
LFLTHSKIIYLLIKHIQAAATIHTYWRQKTKLPISLRDFKNLLKKEEETHNMVMEKHTHTHTQNLKLGSFGEQAQTFTKCSPIR